MTAKKFWRIVTDWYAYETLNFMSAFMLGAASTLLNGWWRWAVILAGGLLMGWFGANFFLARRQFIRAIHGEDVSP
jgi:hypothetical protein